MLHFLINSRRRGSLRNALGPAVVACPASSPYDAALVLMGLPNGTAADRYQVIWPQPSLGALLSN